MERFKQRPQSKLSPSQENKRKRRSYPNVFFKKEITPVFNAIEDPKTMIACFLTFFCALRISEVCKLKWQDIDLDSQKLKVVDGKNHKDGFIPISPACIPILRKWRMMNPNEEYFLPPEAKDSLYLPRRALLFRFKSVLRRAGLDIPTEKNVSGYQQHQYKFHTLRHSRCTHLLNNGVPIQKVQQFMRHDKIETTMTYTWITNPELQKMVAEVDQPASHNILLEKAPNVVIQQSIRSDPIDIAKRRLAFGEISAREFKRIIGMLQTPLSV